MHSHSAATWAHPHQFLGSQHAANERRVLVVVGITAVTMVLELAVGAWSGSMALLADGWHMGTHAAALGISAGAYIMARRHARNPHYSFGTGKFGDLAAFASAVVLALVALQVAYESAMRLVAPVEIAYREAIAVTVLGLLVNLASAWWLREVDHHHGHDDHDHGHHDHDHDHHHHGDNNLRAAFLHVVADAATSVFALLALVLAMSFGWRWADPVVGFAGAVLIASWSIGLLRSSSAVLLDAVPAPAATAQIRERLERDGDVVTDLHVWQVGPGHHAAVVALVSDHPELPSFYKQRLVDVPGLSHVTVEVERCPHGHLV